MFPKLELEYQTPINIPVLPFPNHFPNFLKFQVIKCTNKIHLMPLIKDKSKLFIYLNFF